MYLNTTTRLLSVALMASVAAAAVEPPAVYSIPSQNGFNHDFGIRLPGDVLNLNVVPDPGITGLTGHVDNGSSAGWVGGPSFTCVIPYDFSGLHLGKFSGTYSRGGSGGGGGTSEPPKWSGESSEDVPFVESVVWTYNGSEITEGNDAPVGPIGVKWDPGALTSGGGLRDGLVVKIKVSTTKSPKSGIKVYINPIDVDDPSSDVAPVDSNGSVGGDNRQAFSWSPSVGVTDAEGIARISFTVSKRPGDNERVGASTVASEVQGLNVSNVLPDENLSHPSLTHGKLSRMLTIWRGLHIETASMDSKPAYNYPDDNLILVDTLTVDVATNTTTIHTFGAIQSPEICHYEGGRITLDGTSYSVIDNTANSVFSDSIKLKGIVPAAVITSVESTVKNLHDDDVQEPYLPLPLTIDDEVKGYYKQAYIAIDNYGSLHSTTSFETNLNAAQIILGTFAPTPNYPTTEAFWATMLVSGYQGQTNHDADPDIAVDPLAIPSTPEDPTVGITSNFGSHCIVFLELFREDPSIYFGTTLSRTIAHEIGHAGTCEHSDDALMQAGAVGIDGFSDISINRLRSLTIYQR